MINIVKLHLRNKLHSLTLLVLIFLTITLLLVSLQLTLGSTGTIRSGMIFLGGWFGFLGPLFVLTRGKNGEGNFLSRLPMSRYEVFLGKVIFLIIAYLLVTACLCAGNWIIAGLVALLSNSANLSGMPDSHAILSDVVKFFKIMPLFLFLAALVLWLQKWIRSNAARSIVILGIVLVFGLIPLITALSVEHHTLTISSRDIVNYLNAYGTPLIVAVNLVLFFGAMALYRLRHFRNF